MSRIFTIHKTFDMRRLFMSRTSTPTGGYLMMVGLVFHLVWHWQWGKMAARKQRGK